MLKNICLELDNHATRIINTIEKYILEHPARVSKVTYAEITLTDDGNIHNFSYSDIQDGQKASEAKFFTAEFQPGDLPGPISNFNELAIQFAKNNKMRIKVVTDKYERFGNWPFFFLSVEVWHKADALEKRLIKTIPEWKNVYFSVQTAYGESYSFESIQKRIRARLKSFSKNPDNIKTLAEFIYSSKERRSWFLKLVSLVDPGEDAMKEKVIAKIKELAIEAVENLDLDGAEIDKDKIKDIVDDYWFNMGYMDLEYEFEDDPAEAKMAKKVGMEKIFRKTLEEKLKEKLKTL